jgi:hypothetical protein
MQAVWERADRGIVRYAEVAHPLKAQYLIRNLREGVIGQIESVDVSEIRKGCGKAS